LDVVDYSSRLERWQDGVANARLLSWLLVDGIHDCVLLHVEVITEVDLLGNCPALLLLLLLLLPLRAFVSLLLSRFKAY